MNIEKFNLSKKGDSIFSLPLSMRTIMYKDITELLDEGVELGSDGDGNYSGYQSELLPMVYIMNTNNIIAILYVVGKDGKYENGERIAMNIPIENIDRLVEE